ncbi:hypothetical protein FEM33_15250 [Dyadobacter flavalbus]|uniref:Uncharacterized protein n=1 Tax=Dyadobacter flavalbus TaxID=2579942 RepID=A0A5M8QS12_9BACT|nr:hypothetical protein [Dyadobacter flavalbus]KAA6438869.1 hypothetical protein FEM33_15250 [Dyadobacter flavalbus]
MDDSQRKQEMASARTKFATLQQRSLYEIAHEVGIKGIVSDMNTMGTEDWKTTSLCLFWLLNNTDYPYDKTVLDLYADLDAILKGHNDIRFIS